MHLLGHVAHFGGAYRSFLLDLVVFYVPFFYVAAILPILVAVTKVGCFLSGCCYGRESATRRRSSGASQTMGCQTTVPSADPEKRVFPIQLVDCGANAAVFLLAHLLRRVGRLRVRSLLHPPAVPH